MKTVKLAFTGVACLMPAYAGQQDVGPLRAVLPSSPRARLGSNAKTQVDAHFIFAAFPYVHLVQDEEKVRKADHKVRNVAQKDIGLCFFDREEITMQPPPKGKIRYNLSGPSTGVPKRGYTHVDWIPRWESFAKGRAAKFKDGLGPGKFDFVGFTITGGEVAAGFVCALTPKVEFLNGSEAARYYAHEIVVTLEYDDDVEHFILHSEPAKNVAASKAAKKGGSKKKAPITAEVAMPQDLKFTWGTAEEIRITIANGSLASLNSVVNDSCGHEHQGRVDFEFEIIYDVVSVNGDQTKRPVPQVKNSEIRQIPCIATMI